MNLIKESLFPSSKSPATKTKSKKSSHNPLKQSAAHSDNQSLVEPLLSPSENDDNNSIELGSIDSDDEVDEKQTGSRPRHILRSRHIKTNSAPAAHGGGSIVIVEKPVRPQETLQAFAIRYRVPVSQLKRLNNLQNDQDFYALTYCRVPVRRFGLLHDSTSSSSSPSIIVDLNEQSPSSAVPVTHLNQQNHHAFLNAMDHDLASMRAKMEQLIDTPPATLIPQPPITGMIVRSSSKAKSELNCDGADCGCKLWHIILAIVLVALLAPLIYIYIYLKYPSELVEHHPN